MRFLLDGFSGEEQKLLERYRFDAYVQSSGRIQCDTDVSAILRGTVQGFSPPMRTQGTILHAYKDHLEELHYKHQFFACRKGLAKCDFIKCDSDFDEIFQRIKSEKKWPQLHESVIRIALDEWHFTSPKLIQVKDSALVAKNRILEKISGLKVRRVGRSFGGPSTRLVPGLVLFASIAALGIGKKKA